MVHYPIHLVSTVTYSAILDALKELSAEANGNTFTLNLVDNFETRHTTSTVKPSERLFALKKILDEHPEYTPIKLPTITDAYNYEDLLNLSSKNSEVKIKIFQFKRLLNCEIQARAAIRPKSNKENQIKHTQPVKLAYNIKNNRLFNAKDRSDYITAPTGQIRFLLATLWRTSNQSLPSVTLWDMYRKSHNVRKGDEPEEEFKSSINKFNPVVAAHFLQEDAIVRNYVRTRDPEENTISLNDDSFDFTDVN